MGSAVGVAHTSFFFGLLCRPVSRWSPPRLYRVGRPLPPRPSFPAQIRFQLGLMDVVRAHTGGLKAKPKKVRALTPTSVRPWGRVVAGERGGKDVLSHCEGDRPAACLAVNRLSRRARPFRGARRLQAVFAPAGHPSDARWQ